jgi:hydrogenase nickel incorporation protein HypB
VSIQHVKIVKNLLANNDQAAERNRARLAAAEILAVNVIAAPGAGKTSLIIKTLAALHGKARVGVIEGDIAGSIDTEKVLAAGACDAVQINTGGNCHLEAGMVQQALDDLDLDQLDVIFVENVGNLVCPTHWALGEQIKLCLASTAEGHDKPLKYPEIFAVSDVIVLNKIDLIELVDFERDCFYSAVRALNPTAPIFEVSCRSGQGILDFGFWILDCLAKMR